MSGHINEGEIIEIWVTNTTQIDELSGTVIFESSTPTSENVTLPKDGLYQIICVAGGGGGTISWTNNNGWNCSSGGGGGGFCVTANIKAGTYPIQVGAGGAGAINTIGGQAIATAGTDSFFDTLVANKGGNAVSNNNKIGLGGVGGAVATLANTANITVTKTDWNKKGANGATDSTLVAYVAPGAAVYENYGKGGYGTLNAENETGHNGYVKITYIGTGTDGGKKSIDEGWYNNNLIYAGFPRPGDYVLNTRGHYEEQEFKIKKNGWYKIYGVAGGGRYNQAFVLIYNGAYQSGGWVYGGGGSGYGITTYLTRGKYNILVGGVSENTYIKKPGFTLQANHGTDGSTDLSHIYSGTGGSCSLPDSTLENTWVEEFVSNGGNPRQGTYLTNTAGGIVLYDVGSAAGSVHNGWGNSNSTGGMSIQFLGKNWTTDRSLQIDVPNVDAEYYYNNELVFTGRSYTFTKPIKTVGNIKVAYNGNTIFENTEYPFVYQKSPVVRGFTYGENGIYQIATWELNNNNRSANTVFYAPVNGSYRIAVTVTSGWGDNGSLDIDLLEGSSHTIVGTTAGGNTGIVYQYLKEMFNTTSVTFDSTAVSYKNRKWVGTILDNTSPPDVTFDVKVYRLGNLSLNINVPATITIDGTQVATNATSFVKKLTYNQEISYEISAGGYVTQTGTYTYTDNTFQNKTLEITLEAE